MTRRDLRRILATTDVHSSLDRATGIIADLQRARRSSLVVDCGGFFEGTGYYRLGGGSTERRMLTGLYDVIAPGSRGWHHHFEPELHALTVCTNVIDTAGKPLFRRLHLTEIGAFRVAVTAIIGARAFAAIPEQHRVGHQVIDPVQSLRRLLLEHHHQADAWIVLSHSGFAEDLRLAKACPFLNVIFAGHCRSDRYEPARVGDTLVLKGRELGLGYAVAEPNGRGWTARTCRFSDITSAPPDALRVGHEVDRIRRLLAAPLGRVVAPWRGATPDPRRLLIATAEYLRTTTGADAVILNETGLQIPALGETLYLGELLAIEPFAHNLVYTTLPNALGQSLPDMLDQLATRTGRLTTAPDPLPHRLRTILTTDYLADTVLGTGGRSAGIELAQAIRHTLTGS